MEIVKKFIITGDEDEMRKLYKVFLELNQYVTYFTRDENTLEITVKQDK